MIVLNSFNFPKPSKKSLQNLKPYRISNSTFFHSISKVNSPLRAQFSPCRRSTNLNLRFFLLPLRSSNKKQTALFIRIALILIVVVIIDLFEVIIVFFCIWFHRLQMTQVFLFLELRISFFRKKGVIGNRFRLHQPIIEVILRFFVAFLQTFERANVSRLGCEFPLALVPTFERITPFSIEALSFSSVWKSFWDF